MTKSIQDNAAPFGGDLTEFTVVSGTQITATVLAAAVTGPITVNTPSGSVTPWPAMKSRRIE